MECFTLVSLRSKLIRKTQDNLKNQKNMQNAPQGRLMQSLRTGTSSSLSEESELLVEMFRPQVKGLNFAVLQNSIRLRRSMETNQSWGLNQSHVPHVQIPTGYEIFTREKRGETNHVWMPSLHEKTCIQLHYLHATSWK